MVKTRKSQYGNQEFLIRKIYTKIIPLGFVTILIIQLIFAKSELEIFNFPMIVLTVYFTIIDFSAVKVFPLFRISVRPKALVQKIP